MRKHVFGHRLKNIGHYRMYQWRANARVRFAHTWDESVSLHFTHAQRHICAWCDPL